MSSEVYRRIKDVNVFGTFNVTRLAVGVRAKNFPDENDQRGVIINMASVAAYDAPGAFAVHGASKAAVAGMTLPLARAFSPKGIRVAAVAHGLVETPRWLSHWKLIPRLNLSPKRQGKPDEIAHMIQSVIENAVVNAQVIRVDGGYSFVPVMKILKKWFCNVYY